MKYRLVVITHGDSETLSATMATFQEFVTPKPNDRQVVYDGPKENWSSVFEKMGGLEATVHGGNAKEGFCKTTKRAWTVACADLPAVDFVFWLEHDFRFIQPVDLVPMGEQLEADVNLAQIALMRGPENEEEITAGGIVASRPDEFTQKHTNLLTRSESYPYLEHTSFFTTNPSLLRQRFMRLYPFPEHESECEGRFGIDLVEQGFHFAFWGSGEPWVKHTGTRTGFGY